MAGEASEPTPPPPPGRERSDQGADGELTSQPPGPAAIESWVAALTAGPVISERFVRNAPIDAWLAEEDRALIPEVTRWARELERWDVLEKIWLGISEDTDNQSIQTLEVFRDLPMRAREAHPNLTWASGAAASALTESLTGKVQVAWDRVLLDSATLHADWPSRSDTDDAVIGGTFRMIGEQRQPGTRIGQSLDAAWRTKERVDALIETRAGEGRGAGRRSQAVFRAFSARLALARYDPLRAIIEARWATMLSDWEPASILAAGLEALALSVSTGERRVGDFDPQLSTLKAGSGGVGLSRIGRVYLTLAGANLALRGLDRDGVDHFLDLVSAETSAMAGGWSIRASAAATRAALWGDPLDGLNALAEDIARLSRIGSEQDEPIGKALLARAQTALLIRAGAFAAASDSVAAQPERFRVQTQARVLLWAGEYAKAIALADGAPYEPGLELGERRTLTLVRAAAGLLNNDRDDDLMGQAVREMRWLVDTGSFAHLAMLPRVAREALVDLFRPEVDASEPNFLLLLQRLEQLNDSGTQGPGPVRLTEREQLLLPLLATDDSVPQIARHLQVSVNTVRKQVTTLRLKFGAETRAELIRKARLRGDIR